MAQNSVRNDVISIVNYGVTVTKVLCNALSVLFHYYLFWMIVVEVVFLQDGEDNN